MARPIWSGTLSFGLLHIPIQLMPGERRTDLHFRLLDSRDNAPVRYERVNSETGDEVPWKDIVKAFEYDKGSYIVVEEEDFRAAAPESHEAVEIEAFVEEEAIDPAQFEKPYVLVPAKKAEKGYVLLRETLLDAKRVGIARVVIRSREHLCAVVPRGAALLLLLLRYPQELVELDEFNLPDKKIADYRVTKKELDMARQLIDSMAGGWDPSQYRDEFRERLRKVIEKRLQNKQGVTAPTKEEVPEHAATNVVDFMSLLKKSISSKRRTPAAAAHGGAAKKKPAKARKKTARKRKSA